MMHLHDGEYGKINTDIEQSKRMQYTPTLLYSS